MKTIVTFDIGANTIINGKLPCEFKFHNTSTSKQKILVIIEEIGGIADHDYFFNYRKDFKD